MLQRKKMESTVRNVTAKWIDHLAGYYVIFLGEKHILEISLILRVVPEQQNLTLWILPSYDR